MGSCAENFLQKNVTTLIIAIGFALESVASACRTQTLSTKSAGAVCRGRPVRQRRQKSRASRRPSARRGTAAASQRTRLESCRAELTAISGASTTNSARSLGRTSTIAAARGKKFKSAIALGLARNLPKSPPPYTITPLTHITHTNPQLKTQHKQSH